MTAVGSPATTSRAKLGPEMTAVGTPSPRVSASTSWPSLWVPASMPLQASATRQFRESSVESPRGRKAASLWARDRSPLKGMASTIS